MLLSQPRNSKRKYNSQSVNLINAQLIQTLIQLFLTTYHIGYKINARKHYE